MEESEFGNGLTYCIGLFLAHADRIERYKKDGIDLHWAEMWFSGASDHLYGLDTSQITNSALRKKINKWKEKVLHWRHGLPKLSATEKNVYWSLAMAKEFLRQIDEKMLKTKTIQGQWE